MTKNSPMSPPRAVGRGARYANNNGNAFSKAGLSVGAIVDHMPAWRAQTVPSSPSTTVMLNASSASMQSPMQSTLASVAAISLVVLGAVAMCSFTRRRREQALGDPERQSRSLHSSQHQQYQHPLSRYQPTGAQRPSHRATLVLSPSQSQLAAASLARPLATADIAKRQSIDPIYILANQPSPLAISLEAQRATMSPALRMRLSARLTLVTSDHAVSAATFKVASGDKKQAFFDPSPDATESDDITETACDDDEKDGDQEIDEDDPYARMPASPSTIQSFCSPYIALDLDRSPLVPLATSLALESQVDLARDVSQITLERYEHEGVADAAEGETRGPLPCMGVVINQGSEPSYAEKRLTALHVQAQHHPLVSSSASSTSSISRSNTNSSAMTITPLMAGIGSYSQTYDHSNSVPNPYPSPVATDRLRPAPLELRRFCICDPIRIFSQRLGSQPNLGITLIFIFNNHPKRHDLSTQIATPNPSTTIHAPPRHRRFAPPQPPTSTRHALHTDDRQHLVSLLAQPLPANPPTRSYPRFIPNANPHVPGPPPTAAPPCPPNVPHDRMVSPFHSPAHGLHTSGPQIALARNHAR
ncbi:hypothetical protein BCR44DRAFT_23235 [Catenaria anguillulae PL171]|uniref:Uncharacterized protein n=1 Tax=Catenaria anguillulae PL171 TaxID=765915 RepID=A0A1Y2HNM5_9FUNG|nr:hypothetical protein BCR44DRAFT_23235 [Catenaria anguillulae PL171]